MRTVTAQERRDALVSRHRLAGDAVTPEDVTRGVVALHATDPATVYLSVLARCASGTLADVANAMYERRSLVRWLAMRRTLFVFDRADVPVVQAAVSTPLAATLLTQLVNRLRRNGAEPAIDGEVVDWVHAVGDDVERTLGALGAATGAQLAAEVALLRTSMPGRTATERPQNVTTSLLTWLSAEGRIVRSTPTGAWTSRHHRWEPVARWWPDGLPVIDVGDARSTLARRWLERFGPATVDDLQWWTGWNKTVTREVLSASPVEEIDLHGRSGIALRDEDAVPPGPADQPIAALLPALDPTPMGWKHRDWFFDIDAREVFDAAGNVGPTVWWDGRVVGSWAVVDTGEVRTVVRGDHGSDAAAAVQASAEQLQSRLDGAVVTPAVRTPLERSLT